MEDYRRVTLQPSLYKVYTSVIAEKLREEVEGDDTSQLGRF